MDRRIIDYNPNYHRIQNIGGIRRRSGARFLLVIDSPYENEFVAKRWLVRLPEKTGRIEAIIRF